MEGNVEGNIIEDTANELADRLKPGIDEAKERLESLNARVTGFVKEHPGACLLGALALGYALARLARREQS